VEPLALTVAQAAQLGGPGRSAIYQDIRAGRLRAIKRGRSTRILMEDIKSYLASFPSFRDKAGRLPPVSAKEAADRKGSDAQTSFDSRGSQNHGGRQMDRALDGGV
jgi:excisionase family DNA binding protein